uniref:Uncharacterized protein n=1 Tax=Mycena chlorophos TaxID=658473 RepID=A0ABQ0LWK3_MYCCL|nr:predicted protein [Mycena chlorophos]
MSFSLPHLISRRDTGGTAVASSIPQHLAHLSALSASSLALISRTTSAEPKSVASPTAPAEFESLRISSTTPSSSPETALCDIRAAALAQAFPQPPKARKAKAGNTIRRSTFRPHIPAKQRILGWTTPYAVEQQRSYDHIPAPDQAAALAEMANADKP